MIQVRSAAAEDRNTPVYSRCPSVGSRLKTVLVRRVTPQSYLSSGRLQHLAICGSDVRLPASAASGHSYCACMCGRTVYDQSALGNANPLPHRHHGQGTSPDRSGTSPVELSSSPAA